MTTLVSHGIEEVSFLMTNNYVRAKYTSGVSHKHPLLRRHLTCRCVYVTFDVVVPSEHEVSIPVRATLSSLSSCVGTFVLDNRSNINDVNLG